jgi:flagellar basal body P-ring formation protein FlgA
MNKRSILPVALLVAAWAMPVAAQMLEMQARAVITGSSVRLKDIVRDSASLPEGWGDREIAQAPAPQEVMNLALADVAMALNNYDDMHSVVLRGRYSIELSSEHRTVSLTDVQRALDDYVRDMPEWEGRRFAVTADRFELRPVQAEGALHVTIHSLREGSERGQATATIQVSVDGRPSGDPSMQVHLTELRPYWATTRPLNRGDVLASSHLERHWLAEADAGRFYPASHVVEGMELRRNMQAGQMLAAGMLAEPVYARRGEMLRVISARGPLTVTLRARALADGRRDERILCVNENSGRRMQVRLISPREALLEDEGIGDSRS